MRKGARQLHKSGMHGPRVHDQVHRHDTPDILQQASHLQIERLLFLIRGRRRFAVKHHNQVDVAAGICLTGSLTAEEDDLGRLERLQARYNRSDIVSSLSLIGFTDGGLHLDHLAST